MQNGSYDPGLGDQIHNMLVANGLESPMVTKTSVVQETKTRRHREAMSSIRDHVQAIMHNLNMDLEDDSLRDTPMRVAKMFCDEIFTGMSYDNFPRCTTFQNKMKADQLVAITEIAVRSMCEHHFMPFIGTATVAYIPGGVVLGTSKFNRIVDFFARRPQVQERLIEQISATLQWILDTEDVAIIVKSDHMCTRFRGVQDFHSSMVTSKLCGRFRKVPELRAEFIALTKGP